VTACNMLNIYAEALVGGFFPYVQTVSGRCFNTRMQRIAPRNVWHECLVCGLLRCFVPLCTW